MNLKINKIEINSKTLDELIIEINSLEAPTYRAKQIYAWIHKNLVTSFDDMKNIPKDLIKKLDDKYYISNLSITEKYESSNDNTTKYLLKTDDNNIIESVFMKYSFGNTICISTQIGCHMGCNFCASTVNGLVRNLTTAEILNQVYIIKKHSQDNISNIVLMGSGEPLENFEHVIKFINIINSKDGLNIGERHITLSTCGLVDKIYDLAKLKLQINLAVSLHAPNDDIRASLMPIAKKYKIDELLKACKDYVKTTGRRVTFEYALIKNVNDSYNNAKELSKKLQKLNCHINLIPVNDVLERDYTKSNKNTIDSFAKVLEDFGVNTTIRRKLGSDINAACGQLRNKTML